MPCHSKFIPALLLPPLICIFSFLCFAVLLPRNFTFILYFALSLHHNYFLFTFTASIPFSNYYLHTLPCFIFLYRALQKNFEKLIKTNKDKTRFWEGIISTILPLLFPALLLLVSLRLCLYLPLCFTVFNIVFLANTIYTILFIFVSAPTHSFWVSSTESGIISLYFKL